MHKLSFYYLHNFWTACCSILLLNITIVFSKVPWQFKCMASLLCPVLCTVWSVWTICPAAAANSWAASTTATAPATAATTAGSRPGTAVCFIHPTASRVWVEQTKFKGTVELTIDEMQELIVAWLIPLGSKWEKGRRSILVLQSWYITYTPY